MISSAPDTGHFLQALFDGHGRLLSNATIARMTDFDEEFTEDDGDLKNPPFIEVGILDPGRVSLRWRPSATANEVCKERKQCKLCARWDNEQARASAHSVLGG